MIELIDTHAHLQDDQFDSDRAAVVARARVAGVTTIVVPGVDLETSSAAIDLTNSYEGVYATVGYHPHEASHLDDDALRSIEAMLEDPKCIAVGEIGLDFYRIHSPHKAQVEAFDKMLALAEQHAMPVVIHCRDAWDALAEQLVPWAARVMPAFADRPLGMLHYFSSNVEAAQHYAALGFVISIHTSVTHSKSMQLREVASTLPLDSLLIETDSPYGAPQSQRGRRNEPAYVIEAARCIAEARDISLEDVAAATTANARRLFGLPAVVGSRP